MAVSSLDFACPTEQRLGRETFFSILQILLEQKIDLPDSTKALGCIELEVIITSVNRLAGIEALHN